MLQNEHHNILLRSPVTSNCELILTADQRRRMILYVDNRQIDWHTIVFSCHMWTNIDQCLQDFIQSLFAVHARARVPEHTITKASNRVCLDNSKALVNRQRNKILRKRMRAPKYVFIIAQKVD